MSQFDNVEGALVGFLDGPVMKFMLLLGIFAGLGAALVRQTFAPLMAVIMLGLTTTVLGPMLSTSRFHR